MTTDEDLALLPGLGEIIPNVTAGHVTHSGIYKRLMERFNDLPSLRGRFGAAADGSTDDTAAFNGAIEAKGAVVTPGDYRITEGIDITSSSNALLFLPGARIVVDDGYDLYVFRITSDGGVSTKANRLIGGCIYEAGADPWAATGGSTQQNWDAFVLDGVAKGVYGNSIREWEVHHCKRMIHLRTNGIGSGFVTPNTFDDLIAWHPRMVAEWENQLPSGGIDSIHMRKVDAQSGPLTTTGFLNIDGRRTQLWDCNIYDLDHISTEYHGGPGLLPSGNIVATADETTIIGGTVDALAFEDLGADTLRLTAAARMLKQPKFTYGNAEITLPGAGLIVPSPDGTRWLVRVNDSGAVTTTAL